MNLQILHRSFRIAEAAPVISLAIALILPRVLSHDPADALVIGPDPVAVVTAVESVPYSIGAWAGVDVAMPESAIRLLQPNATLSRKYRELQNGASLDFVFIHCGDARDMLGHYPPVCYPNSGWVPLESETEGRRGRARGVPVDLDLNGKPFVAQMYHFSRMETWTSESKIRIFNFFVLPDGTLTNSIDDVRRKSRWLGASILGVGQVQLLTDGNVPLEEAIRAANEILAGNVALFDALGVPRHE